MQINEGKENHRHKNYSQIFLSLVYYKVSGYIVVKDSFPFEGWEVKPARITKVSTNKSASSSLLVHSVTCHRH